MRLNKCLKQCWLYAVKWQEVRQAVTLLSDHVHDYAGYLESKCREHVFERLSEDFTPKAISVSATGIEEEKHLEATFFVFAIYLHVCLQYVNVGCGFLGNFPLIDANYVNVDCDFLGNFPLID